MCYQVSGPWRALEVALKQVLLYTLSFVRPKTLNKTILFVLVEIILNEMDRESDISYQKYSAYLWVC